MVQWLGALHTLAVELSSFPSTHKYLQFQSQEI